MHRPSRRIRAHASRRAPHRYWRSPADYLAGREELGAVSCGDGAVVFVKDSPKDVAKGHYRFTLKDASRELKLRAASQSDVDQWVAVLTQEGRAHFEGSFGAGSERFRGDTVVDVSDGVAPATRAASASLAPARSGA